jgi:hypothetical protein
MRLEKFSKLTRCDTAETQIRSTVAISGTESLRRQALGLATVKSKVPSEAVISFKPAQYTGWGVKDVPQNATSFLKNPNV